jgi:hypothetical protein
LSCGWATSSATNGSRPMCRAARTRGCGRHPAFAWPGIHSIMTATGTGDIDAPVPRASVPSHARRSTLGPGIVQGTPLSHHRTYPRPALANGIECVSPLRMRTASFERPGAPSGRGCAVPPAALVADRSREAELEADDAGVGLLRLPGPGRDALTGCSDEAPSSASVLSPAGATRRRLHGVFSSLSQHSSDQAPRKRF